MLEPVECRDPLQLREEAGHHDSVVANHPVGREGGKTAERLYGRHHALGYPPALPSSRSVARATHPSSPDLAPVQRATRRAVAAPSPALDNRPPASSDRGISPTACSDPRPRAALLRALPHYVGLLSGAPLDERSGMRSDGQSCALDRSRRHLDLELQSLRAEHCQRPHPEEGLVVQRLVRLRQRAGLRGQQYEH